MKYAVAQLEGALLDAAVAKALGLTVMMSPTRGLLIQEDAMALTPHLIWVEARNSLLLSGHRGDRPWGPSNDWSQGGPIIERERIELRWPCAGTRREDVGLCHADMTREPYATEVGPTPLLAAMRAFVASKLGEEVEL